MRSRRPTSAKEWVRLVVSREARWWAGPAEVLARAGAPLGHADALAALDRAGYGDGDGGARLWLDDLFVARGWLQATPGDAVMPVVPLPDFRPDPLRVTGGGDSDGVRRRVLRIAADHLAGGTARDPLVVRSELVEHDIAWSVSVARASPPPGRAPLPVGPLIVPTDSRYPVRFGPSAYPVAQYLSMVRNGELRPWRCLDDELGDRWSAVVELVWRLREQLADATVAPTSTEVSCSIGFAAYELEADGPPEAVALLRGALETPRASREGLDALARLVLRSLGHPAPPVPLPAT